MYIFGEDVAQTDPNTAHVVAALENLEFLVCQDIFETETTKYADVILPASSFLEKQGTFTNAERRIQLVAPAIDPPGERARPTSRSSRRLARARPRAWAGTTPEDAMARDRRADAALRRRHLRAARPHGPAVAGRARRHRRADPLRATSSTLPGGTAQLRRAALQGAGRRGRRRVPADPRHRPRLQHYNAGTMTRRTGNLELDRPRLPRDPPRRRRAAVDRRRRHGLGPQPAGPDRDRRAGDRPDRAAATSSPTFHFPETRTNLLSAPRPTSTPRARSTR